MSCTVCFAQICLTLQVLPKVKKGYFLSLPLNPRPTVTFMFLVLIFKCAFGLKIIVSWCRPNADPCRKFMMQRKIWIFMLHHRIPTSSYWNEAVTWWISLGSRVHKRIYRKKGMTNLIVEIWFWSKPCHLVWFGPLFK